MTTDGSDLLPLAQAALDAYDYEGARALLERAVLSGTGGVEAAQRLLELLVDVLGVDAEALALEPKLSRAARRDVSVRCRLGTAAARVGDTTAALAWVEGLDAPEALGAVLPCARRELEAGHLEGCQSLLERGQRLAPLEPGVSELARALSEEKRFRALLLEEELDNLLARGDRIEAERVARELRARDGRNAKALALLEELERQRAEAAARELLARQASELLAPAERLQRIERLHAAARRPLPEALRVELLRAAEALEAAAREAALDAALERLLAAVRGAASSSASTVATLATPYLELPEAARQLARTRTAEPLFDWLEALGASAPLPRPTLRALEALQRAAALEAANPEANVEAALDLLEPELRALRRVPAAIALHERLTTARARARRAAAEALLAHVQAALGEGRAEHALEGLARLQRSALDPDLEERAEALARDARAQAARQRMEQAVAAHRRRGHPVGARRALDELLGSSALDAQARAHALEQRQQLDAEIRALFAVERIPAPLGDWWRQRVSAELLDSNPAPWACPSSRRAVIPVHAGRWLLLVELALDTGEAAGATRLRLPEGTGDMFVSLDGSRVSILTDQGAVLVLELGSGQIESFWPSEEGSPEVERGWLTRDGRRLWKQRRPARAQQRDEPLQLIDLERRAVVAEYDGAPGTLRVLGHAEVDSIIVHRHRALALDAAGHRIDIPPPADCTAAAAHPRHDGLLVASVDHADTGALTLREVPRRHPERALEVEDISGESLHWVGVSHDDPLVAVLGQTSRPELLVYRVAPEGLSLLWRRECGALDLLIGDRDCRQLHVLRGQRSPEGWLARLDGTPLALAADDARLALDPERAAFAGFELWRCAAESEGEGDDGASARVGAFGASAAGVDAFLSAHPDDYHGLRHLWIERGRRHERDAEAELERLARAHPESLAVKLLGAHECALHQRWDDVERWLAELPPGDAAASDARHLCHLRALACLFRRDTAAARGWIEEGLRHEGACALRELLDTIAPLPPAPPAVQTHGTPGEPSAPSPMLRYRLLLREFDALLEQQPARLLEHPSLGALAPRHPQLLARLAAAWLRIEPTSAEQRAWRALDLTRFCEDRAWLDAYRPEWLLPEAWPNEDLELLEERARRALGEERPGG